MKKRYAALGCVLAAGVGFLWARDTSLGSSLPCGSTKTIEVSPAPKPVEVSRRAIAGMLTQMFETTTVSRSYNEVLRTSGCKDSYVYRKTLGECLSVHVTANVKAGFDRSGFNAKQIEVSPTTVTVYIGSPKIFYAVPDYEKTRVIDQDSGLIWSLDMNQVIEMLRQSNADFIHDACEDHILMAAAQSAEQQMSEHLRIQFEALGYHRTVKIVDTVPAC